MASAAQISANQANSALSTGPASPEGKLASSQNARKHGLSSRYLALSDDERPLFEQLESDLRREINPQGILQESLFRELAAAVWKRDIVNRLLAAAPSSESLFSEEIPDHLRKLLRHKTDQDRAFNRSLRQIRELQRGERLRVAATKQSQSTQPAPAPSPNYHNLMERMKDEAEALDSRIRQYAPHFQRRTSHQAA